MAQKDFDDEYLKMLAEYRGKYPQSEHIGIFAGYFALYYGDVKEALAQDAWKKRKCNLIIWQLLIECYDKLQMLPEKAKFQGYCRHVYGMDVNLQVDGTNIDLILDNMTMSQNIGNYAPFLVNKSEIKDNQLYGRKVCLGGEYVPWSMDKDGYRYWVGVFVNQETINNKGLLLAREKDLPQFLDEYAADMIFDIFKSKSSRDFQFAPQGKKYIIPLAGNEASQEIEIATNEKQYDAILGKWEYSYYRIEEPVKIGGAKEFVVGKPVLFMPLSPEYKVLSEQMRDLGYYCVNIMGCPSLHYTGAGRGYDRQIVNSYAQRVYEGVERTIQQLEALGECDQFLFMHIMDVHPWQISTISMPLAIQTCLSLEDRLW